MAMKVMINGFACDGHAQCTAAAPDLFRLGTDNKAYVLNNSVAAEDEDDVRRAAASCPMNAVLLLET
jgi:ferredoxin